LAGIILVDRTLVDRVSHNNAAHVKVRNISFGQAP
jgi:hypothetical protein